MRNKPLPFRIEDNVQITDEDELMAAWDELTQEHPRLEGYIYRDSEIWCDRQSLERWRACLARARAQDA